MVLIFSENSARTAKITPNWCQLAAVGIVLRHIFAQNSLTASTGTRNQSVRIDCADVRQMGGHLVARYLNFAMHAGNGHARTVTAFVFGNVFAGDALTARAEASHHTIWIDSTGTLQMRLHFIHEDFDLTMLALDSAVFAFLLVLTPKRLHKSDNEPKQTSTFRTHR
jgi:hypothetical protein